MFFLLLLLLLLLLFIYYYYYYFYYYYYYYHYYFYSHTRKRFYWVTFKLEDIHQLKFCITTFFICHYTDCGKGESWPRIGLFIYTFLKQISIITLSLYNLYDGYKFDITRAVLRYPRFYVRYKFCKATRVFKRNYLPYFWC